MSQTHDAVLEKEVCSYCKAEFTKVRPNQIYCCEEHAKLARSTRDRINHQDYHTQFSKQYAKEYIAKQQKEVYELLGNRCQSCGEDDPVVLTIDHIEPVGKNRKLTSQIYSEILHNPTQAHEKYQLLCRNCNWRKMIQNNERQLHTMEFAYKWQIDLLSAKLILLEAKIEKGKQNTTHPKSINSNITSSMPSDLNLSEKLKPMEKLFVNEKGKISAALIRIIAKEKLNLDIGHNKAYTIKMILEREQNEQSNA